MTTTLVHAEAGEIPRRDALMKRNDTSRPIAGLTASGPRPPQGNDLYTQDVFAEPGGLGDATSISAHEPSRTVAVTCKNFSVAWSWHIPGYRKRLSL